LTNLFHPKVLFRFQKENGRSPTEKDAGILNDLKKRYAKEMGIPDEYPFNDELLRCVSII
jgi:hypothetical protein